MSDTRVRRGLRVTGRVQGVGFRYFTWTVARELGVAGWVRNEVDGSVACEVEGPDAAVERFVERLRAGPRHARVDGVDQRQLPPRDEREFAVR